MRAPSRILIVDDEDVVRRSYASALASHCRAECAADGEEAMRAMERAPFDLVLLDLRMPGAGGMSVLEAMKRRWPDREVVVITGYPTVETAKEAVRLGAFDYLAKPIGPDELLGAACRALTRKQWALHGADEEPAKRFSPTPP